MPNYKDLSNKVYFFETTEDMLSFCPNPDDLTEISVEEVVSILNPPLTAEETVAQIEAEIDLYIDKVAKAKGYETISMSPTAACVSYAGYPNIYQQEAIAFGTWKANIWPTVHEIYADVQNGLRPIPTAEEVISELDIMVWPDGE
jgi:hypothetical protein